jgi:hypothetical protein
VTLSVLVEGDSEVGIATTCLAGRRDGHVNSCENCTSSYQAELVGCGNSTNTWLEKIRVLPGYAYDRLWRETKLFEGLDV